jgi:hypothetical protein
MRVLTDIERRIKRTRGTRPEQYGSRAKRNDGRYGSEALLRAAHVELVCAPGARATERRLLSLPIPMVERFVPE